MYIQDVRSITTNCTTAREKQDITLVIWGTPEHDRPGMNGGRIENTTLPYVWSLEQTLREIHEELHISVKRFEIVLEDFKLLAGMSIVGGASLGKVKVGPRIIMVLGSGADNIRI